MQPERRLASIQWAVAVDKTVFAVDIRVLVLHANWFRHPRYGLVGAMDDQDAARIQALVPHAVYRKIPANHVIHSFEPEKYIREVLVFSQQIGT
jgi:hypothetical protein